MTVSISFIRTKQKNPKKGMWTSLGAGGCIAFLGALCCPGCYSRMLLIASKFLGTITIIT